MAKNPRILLHKNETKNIAQKLRSAFPKADFKECNTYAELPEMIATYRPEVIYTVRFAGSADYPHEALFRNSGPLWVANAGAGTDHFGEWDSSRVTVTNAAGVAADMMAEYVMGSFLHFTLNVPGLQADKANRIWAARTVRSLKGATLLIVGLGHTGRAIATRAKAFGMHVIGTRRHPKPTENVDAVHAPSDLLSLLPHADFVAVSTPLTPATKGLIGSAEFNALKHGVIFADVSRGAVVDQTALQIAMERGQIAGAALDVFETEPLPETSPLWRLNNLIISPHCSSVYDGWESESFDLFLKNLRRWTEGQRLRNIVNPSLGY